MYLLIFVNMKALPSQLWISWAIAWSLWGSLSFVAAAQLLPAYGAEGADFVFVSSRQLCLGRLEDNAELEGDSLYTGFQAVAFCQGQLFGAQSRHIWLVQAGPHKRLKGLMSAPIRAMTGVSGFIVLVLGGYWDDGRLREACVCLWDPRTGTCTKIDRVPTSWNPFLLRSFHTNSGASNWLLIGMYKRAPFDPILRPRPFVYRLQAETLAPVWKGTCFARPWQDVVWGQFGLSSVPQLAVLERLPGVAGLKRITIYVWTGTRMLGSAMSPAWPGGNTLQYVKERRLGAWECRNRRWRLLLWEIAPAKDKEDMYSLTIAARSAFISPRPLAWTVIEKNGVLWLVYARTQERLVASPLREE